MEISIKNYISDKIQHLGVDNLYIEHLYADQLQNIYDMMNKFGIYGKGVLYTQKKKIIIKNQIGGIKHKMKFGPNNFSYHLDTIIPYSSGRNRICFMNIDETHDNCACLLYNTKSSGKTSLIIEGIISDDKNFKYKTGDILMLIILKLVQTDKNFSHITKIKLSDVSKKRCYGFGIELKYLKTICDGITFYSKYGFRPEKTSDDFLNNSVMTDYKIFYENKKIFKQNRMISNEDIKKVILDSNLSTNENLFYTKYIKSYVDLTPLIDTSIFIVNLLNLVFVSRDDDVKVSDNTKKIACEFVMSIYKNLYRKIGYLEYKHNIWVKEL